MSRTRACISFLPFLWTLLALLSTGTSRQQPDLSNCQENEFCVCHGTVYYGKKFLDGGVEMTSSLRQMTSHKSTTYQKKEVSGPFLCSALAFHGDPAPGHHKHCLCAPAELLSHPLCASHASHASLSQEADSSRPSSSPPVRVAIGFYGMSLNLRITLPTFKKHIFEVLQRHGAVFDVFASTVLPDDPQRSSKKQTNNEKESFESDEYDLRLMRPCAITLTPLENILAPSEHKGAGVMRYSSSSTSSQQRIVEYTRRSLRAMILSFARVHTALPYDAILVLRPDAAVTSDLDLPNLLTAHMFSSSHLYIPAIFDSQDRAAFGSSAVMAHYLCRHGEVLDGHYRVDKGDKAPSMSGCGDEEENRDDVAFPSVLSLPVKKSRMTIVGVKRDRPLPTYDLMPPLPALGRRLCAPHSSGSYKTVQKPVARVAIGFYGLSRNLRLTLPSFQKHVFDVLDQHNIVYDVFWSTVTAPVLVSNRSNEWSIEMDEYDVRLMRPCVTTLLPMYQVLNETKFDYSHISPHYHYKDGFSSVRNIFCSLRTQQVLASSIQTHATALGVTYDAVATFRPDTAVVRDLDLASLLATRKFSAKHIYLPNFAHFKGVNDRSAYGSQAVMTTYLNRQEAFKISLATNTDRWIYNTETFLKNYLKERKIPVRKSTVRVVRVRADGKIPVYDSDTVVMYMPKKEIQRCQMSVTNASTGETFNVLDTTIC